MEEIVNDIRGIALILKSLEGRDNDVQENDYALDFLSKKLLECAVILLDEVANLKKVHI